MMTIPRLLRIPIDEAVSSFHRRMIVFAGEEVFNWAEDVIEEYVKEKGTVEVLAVYREEDEGAVEAVLSHASKLGCRITSISPRESEEILGGTWDVLLAFSPHEYTPNTLGRIVEAIRGGGILMLLGPRLDEWYAKPAEYHEKLVSPPYTFRDVVRRYTKRLVKTLKEHKGVWVVEDEAVYGSPLKPPPTKQRRPRMPKDAVFPRLIYKMAMTDDQVRVIHKIGSVYGEKKGGRRYLLIRADRGRGKSASLGLALAGLIYNDVYSEIPVTAPSISNAETMFRHLESALTALGYKVRRYSDDGRPVLEANGARVRYLSPYSLAKKEGVFAVVDEAAGIPLPLLLKIAKSYDSVIYASTVHGYEGSGRGFGLRFSSRIRTLRDSRVYEIEMEKPIRYAPEDPIEKWLYDVLLLDAEPEELTESEKNRISPGRVRYKKVDLDSWFEKDEDLLRRFIGTYVTAHYRNRPDDLVILGEAPHHMARIVESEDSKLVVALHLAKEGGLPQEVIDEILTEGKQPHGHLIPAVLLKYVPYATSVAKLKGVRIVRIAVHPELTNRGLGSTALRLLEDELREEGYDWVGASFGASYELLRFWMKNGYSPLHISPMRNAASGEYSVIVAKPISDRSTGVIYEINKEFKERLLKSLHDTYFGLEAGVAYQLLKSGRPGYKAVARLTKNQLLRLDFYVKGYVSYESATDIVRALVEAHLLTSPDQRPEIGEKLEKALLAKSIQGKSWGLAAKIAGASLKEIVEMFREATEKLGEAYAQEE